MNIDELLKILDNNILIKFNYKCKSPCGNRYNKSILLKFIKIYPIFDNIKEIAYLLKHKDNLENLHIFCPICGKKNKFNGYKKGHYSHCSTRCSSLDKNVLNKSKLTKLEKYGDENYHNIEQMKKTNLKKYGTQFSLSSEEIRQKIKNTNLKKYGVTSILKLKKVHDKGIKKAATKASRNKVKNTCLQKYGVENVSKCEIIKNKKKETNLKKYGVEWFAKSDKYKNLFKNKDFVKNFNNSRKNTCLNKYGVQNCSQIKAAQIKRYNTMKLNNTFNKSKPEQRCYEKLLAKFSNVKRNYKTKLYPFACDFYIPELDLYIEYNGYWTHGPTKYHCPFDKSNEEHLNVLKLWEQKSKEINFKFNTKKIYKNAIRIWSIEDPLKLKTFKENNLNYKIFYNEHEFDEWFNSI